jgi:LPXTG-motif cell wall-anchored protein
VAAGVVTLTSAGTYTIVVRHQTTSAVLGTQTVTVVARGAVATLPSTGVDPLPISLGAAALIALGAGGILLARRKRVV